MRHVMHLNAFPFEKIKKGSKTIELRLYDGKRRKVKVGDEVEFTKINSGEKLLTRVRNIFVFATSEQLYANLPFDKCAIPKRNRL